MKNLIFRFSSVLAVLTLTIAEIGAGQASWLGYYQPKAPKSLTKD